MMGLCLTIDVYKERRSIYYVIAILLYYILDSQMEEKEGKAPLAATDNVTRCVFSLLQFSHGFL